MKCLSFIATASMARTVKTKNFTVSPTLMDLLDENDNKKHPAGSQSNIMQDLENLQSNFCPYFPFVTEDPDSENEWILSLFSTHCIFKIISHTIKKNWFVWEQTTGFGTFTKYSPFRNSDMKSARTILSLEEVQLWLCYHLDQWTWTKSLCIMAVIMTRQTNCLQVALDLILDVRTVPMRVEKWLSWKQAHFSH